MENPNHEPTGSDPKKKKKNGLAQKGPWGPAANKDLPTVMGMFIMDKSVYYLYLYHIIY